ncbi:MAG: tetratricopeptide repeat protein [Acidobacteriota bacterium]
MHTSLSNALRFLVVGLLVVLTACAEPPPELPPLEPLPELDLESVEDVARRQIASASERVEQATTESVRATADAYGVLAQLYHAYDLGEAAATAYANARTLDPTAFTWAYLHGVVAAGEGDFPTARAAFERAVELQPRSAQPRLRLANVLLEQGEAEAAAEQLRAFDAGAGAEAALAYGLGRAAASLSDHDDAVAELTRAAELDPQAGAVRHALGLSLARLGREEEAQAALAAGNATPPAFPDPLLDAVRAKAVSSGAYLRRGNQALTAGDLEKAQALFTRGLEADRDSIELRLNLAIAQVRAGALDAARSTLEDARRRAPDNPRVHHDLGNVLREQGRATEAVPALRRAVELEPTYADAWFNLANTLAELDRWPEVGEAVARYREERPDDARGRYLEAMALAAGGERPEAIRRLRALVEAQPDDLVARRGLGGLLAESGDIPAALMVYEQVLASEALDDSARFGVLDEAARLAWQRGRRPEAIALWRRGVEAQPQSSAARTALANALQLAGQRAEAIGEFERAVDLDPSNATAWLSETRLRILENQPAVARGRLEQALALHPENAELAGTAARLYATSTNDAVRDGARAMELARLAYGLDPSLDNAETLAMALAEIGRFEEAIRFQTQLAHQAQQSGDQRTLRRLVKNLRLFQNRRPVRAEATDRRPTRRGTSP